MPSEPSFTQTNKIPLAEKLLKQSAYIEMGQTGQTAAIDGMNVTVNSETTQLRFGYGITLQTIVHLQPVDAYRFVRLLLKVLVPLLTQTQRQELSCILDRKDPEETEQAINTANRCPVD